jgi:hypothetical protein
MYFVPTDVWYFRTVGASFFHYEGAGQKISERNKKKYDEKVVWQRLLCPTFLRPSTDRHKKLRRQAGDVLNIGTRNQSQLKTCRRTSSAEAVLTHVRT